jgi:N-acetylglucosaminyl-diphospho-decaprenol L-rhamnosyltransferase
LVKPSRKSLKVFHRPDRPVISVILELEGTGPGRFVPAKAHRVDESQLQPSTSIRLSVVIVNYRSWPDVERLTLSLANSPSGDSEILIVDNASGEPVPPALLQPIPGVRLILRAENDGFSSGVNAGWRASSSPWIMVLNPDVVPEDGLIGRVLDRIDAYEERPGGAPGVVGFGLRNPDGSHQPSVGAFPGLFRTVWEQFLPRSRRNYQPEWRVRPGPVDWVTGACMLLNGRLLDELGGMDEDFFLYYEEVALCRSATRRGWSVEYDPEVSVVHLRPLQNRAISPKMRVITRHSKLLYFRKHLPHWQFAALGATVRLEARLREAVCRVRGRSREVRSWRVVNRVAKLLAAGADLRGRAVRIMAETVDDPDEEAETLRQAISLAASREAPRQTHVRPRRTRSSQP